MVYIPQGDLALLDHEVARERLASMDVARMAYVERDGTPRVLPMMFMWTGEELVFSAFSNTLKVAAIKARPDVAVTIDTVAVTPQALFLRGRADLEYGQGVGEAFRAIQRRYLPEEVAAARIADAERLGLQGVRISLRPTWVGVVDFRTRFPGRQSVDDFRDSHFAV